MPKKTKAQHLCVQHGCSSLREPGKVRCERHLAMARRHLRNYRKRRVSLGLCHTAACPAEGRFHGFCLEHYYESLARSRDYQTRKRAKEKATSVRKSA